MSDYLKNAWYMAAWSADIGSAMLARRLLGQHLLFFRREDGSIAAMEDRCPHRFAPLAMGRKQGDRIACRYHGLEFDSHGRCIHNPFSQLIPPGAHIRTFTVEEQDSIVWLWAGEQSEADPALIPRFDFLNEPGHKRDTFHIEADYRLIIDNLMDLSHIEFLHTDSFGGGGSILNGTLAVREQDRQVGALWTMDGIMPPPWATSLVAEGERVDHWLDMRWSAPAALEVEVGLARQGQPRTPGIIPPLMGVHVLTPETATASHYFYSTAPGAQPPVDPDAPPAINALEDEDKPMLEAIQQRMGDAEFWSLKPAILSVDAASVRVRRKLAKMILDERKEKATATA